MRVIVPGGYYSYDSAGKKIWLDYQYYGTTLENIEKIKNLTRNKILYDCKRSTVLPTVENGCITHSYPGNEADEDKIQVTLRTPITNSLTELTHVDGVVTLSTNGKVLVLPTANAAILPSFNQSVLNSNRLTIAESPFGGLKGSGSPDYAPGTLYTPTDGVYLTDINGQNSTKTLTAGKLKEVGYLTVDTAAHTITQEFTVRNDSESNNPTVVDNCDALTNWAAVRCSIAIDSTIQHSGTGCISLSWDSTGVAFYAAVTTNNNLSTRYFITLCVKANGGRKIDFYLSSSTNYLNYYKYSLTANGSWQKWVIPIKNPVQTLGTPDLANIVRVRVGQESGIAGDVLYVDTISSDVAKSTYIEAQVPNFLSATSLSLYTHNNTAYQLASTHSLDAAYSQVSQTSSNFTAADGTKFNDIYGAGAGRAVFPKGSASETKAGSSLPDITYSANAGTSKRIGFRIDLPPSDNGRTNFNKCRIKTILTYAPDAENDYSASFDFADSTNTSYGLQNLSKPWIALYSPTDSLIDFYLFTHRPQSLSFKKDETGTIYSLSLYPGTGSVYHGQIPFSDLTLDTNSDTIPDCLEAAVNGSVTKFLANYSMVI